jgi:hypothetical protein
MTIKAVAVDSSIGIEGELGGNELPPARINGRTE